MGSGEFGLVNPESLTPSAFNDRVHDDGTFDALVDDVAERGVLRAGMVTAGRVLGGWHRAMACKKLGAPFPAFGVPVMSRADERLVVATDNDLDGFTSDLHLGVDLHDELSPGWWSGHVTGRPPKLPGCDRLLVAMVERVAARGAAASVQTDGEQVTDDWAWAVWHALTGNPVVLRLADSVSPVRSVGRWDATPHPSMGRWGVKGNHRRISPLWKWLLGDNPGRVLDIGCGWGWHLAQVPAWWSVVGYEPYRRQRGTHDVDRRWVRNSIRRVADDVRAHGLFDHVVLDHVLFLTGSTEAALTCLDAAASLVGDDGVVWVSNYWHRLKSTAAKVDEQTRLGGQGAKRYVVRTWSRGELTDALNDRFDHVEFSSTGETHLYRCTGPKVRSLDAVRSEFDLEWEDGTRPGVVSELLEVLPWR